MALLKRRAEEGRTPIHFVLDGAGVRALAGDTLLTAILIQADALRRSDVDGAPRAGFCLMGACQDCWVTGGQGERWRACTTMAADGMTICTGRA